MSDRVGTLVVMPASIHHSATEADESHANTDNDAHHEFVMVSPRTGRAVAMGAR